MLTPIQLKIGLCAVGLFLAIPSSSAQVDYTRLKDGFSDYSCLYEVISYLDSTFLKLVPEESAGAILVFNVSDRTAKLNTVFVQSSSGDIDKHTIEDTFLHELPSVQAPACRLITSEWFALPVAIHHPVYTGWSYKQASDLRRSPALLNLYIFLATYEPENLLPTLFLSRGGVMHH